MSREQADEILAALDIEFYLDYEGISYKKSPGARGTQLNLKSCPCCGSDDWKVYLNAENGLGNCFHGGCETKFNKLKFIKAHLGNPSWAVVNERLLALGRVIGWQPARVVERPVTVPSEVKLPDSIPLPIDGRNLVYLEERGISGEMAAMFHLRFCENGWFNYTWDGARKGMNFGQRVIIPVFDLAGEMVTFQGRDITGEADRKYLFPPGLPSTGRYLYNGHNAIGARRIVVGEGAFDVMAQKIALLSHADMRAIEAVGTFGKHLSHKSPEAGDQLGAFIKLREKGLEEATIMWDGEQAALRDALAAGQMLKGVGIKARVALLPKGKDPNEVDATTVIKALWAAQEVTPALVARLKIKNPYR